MDNEQQTNQEQQQNPNEEGKTFTQDEVNRIVSERLKKEKGKIDAEREAEYSKREADLNMREIKIKARESLIEKGLPGELGDVLNCSNEDELNKCIEILERHYSNNDKEKKELHPGFVGFFPKAPAEPRSRNEILDPIKEAMGLK